MITFPKNFSSRTEDLLRGERACDDWEIPQNNTLMTRYILSFVIPESSEPAAVCGNIESGPQRDTI